VSVIVEASESAKASERVVSLLLFDTSGKEPVNVGDILVEEGCATDVTA